MADSHGFGLISSAAGDGMRLAKVPDRPPALSPMRW
jgi:hypothetical protein